MTTATTTYREVPPPLVSYRGGHWPMVFTGPRLWLRFPVARPLIERRWLTWAVAAVVGGGLWMLFGRLLLAVIDLIRSAL